MGAMPAIVAGSLVVGATDAAAGVDGVPPVVIVISDNPVPTTVMGFQRIVRPAHAGVLVADDDALASEAHCPDLWSIYILHAPLDGGGITGCDAKVRNRRIFDPTSRSVGIHARHIRTGSQCLHQRAVCVSNNHVDHPERLISNSSGVEKISNPTLSASGMLSQGVINEPATRILVSHARASADVSLVGEQDDN